MPLLLLSGLPVAPAAIAQCPRGGGEVGSFQLPDGGGAFPENFGFNDPCLFDVVPVLNVSNTLSEDRTYSLVLELPLEMELIDPASSGITITNEVVDVPGFKRTYFGTFTVPNIEPEVGIGNFPLQIRRNGTWSPDPSIKVIASVFDPVCPQEPALFSDEFWIDFSPNFQDLRETNITKLSELKQLGWVLNANSPPGSCGVGRLYIDQVLEIDEPLCFDPGVPNSRITLVLEAGAKIIVNGNVSLYMENVDIFTCPTASLADGIEVKIGGRLEMQNCTVADCRVAVDAKPASFLAIEGTQFTNNYIGVNLNMSGALAPFQRVSSLVLKNNVFETAIGGALKPPYPGMQEVVGTRGYAGILLNDYLDFNVWARNDFARLNNGLVAFNSTMNIGDFHFDDMRSADVPNVYSLTDGHGIVLNADNSTSWANINEPWLPAMTFNNCKTGISAGKYAGRIENCNMTNVDAGIAWWISRNRDVRILNNTISARANGITSAFNEPLASFGNKISQMDNNVVTLSGTFPGNDANNRQGIYLLELGHDNPDGGWLVTDNTITLQRGGKGIAYANGNFGALQANTINNADPSFPYQGIEATGVGFSTLALNDITQTLATGNAETFGIYSEAGFANRYDCNCLDNTGVGMQFYDMGDFTDGVRGNKFNTHNTTGLRLGIDGLPAIIGTQEHTGNEWDLGAIPSGENGGENFGGNFGIILLSEFTVDPNEKGGALNPPVFPSSGWFNPDATAEPSYNCTNQCAAPNLERPPFAGETATPTGLDLAIINGTFTTTDFEAPMEWKAAYRVYRKMLRQPALVQSSAAATAFKLRHDTLSTGELAWVAEQRAGLYTLTSEQDSILGLFITDIDSVAGDIADLDELIQDGDTVNQSQYDTLVLQRANAQTQLEQWWDTIAQSRLLRIQTLLQINNAVSTTITIDGNHKTFNDIVLRFFASDTLATGDLTTLETIAAQCPLEGGDAVYEARAMVSYFTGDQYDNSACIGGGEREGISEITSVEKAITIFPNPATNMITIQGAPENAWINIIDQFGRTVYSSRLQSNRIELMSLQSGVFTVQVFSSENTALTTQKLVFVK